MDKFDEWADRIAIAVILGMGLVLGLRFMGLL